MARSALEETLDSALKELYPRERIAEDMPIKVRGHSLFVDRVIRGPKIAIEIDGRQHTEFVAHFHKDKDGFAKHRMRDRIKDEWLRENGFTIVRINYDEKITKDILRAKIIGALTEDDS
jgi:very-short-patch-repair endonuclease